MAIAIQNIDWLYANNPDVFVAGDLLLYPVHGNNKIAAAPDTMVVFGRPKGDRGSYKQWLEGDPLIHITSIDLQFPLSALYENVDFFDDQQILDSGTASSMKLDIMKHFYLQRMW